MSTGSAAEGTKRSADPGLLSALAGTEANHTCDVAGRASRVVKASLGVMREQKAGRARTRSVALAAALVVVLLIGPLVWWAVDELTAGGHLSDPTSQLALWVCILCPALAAAALMAGWMHRRP